MRVAQSGDPRLEALLGATDPRENGIRPAVRLPRRGMPPVAFGLIAATFAVFLFILLDGRRTTEPASSVTAQPNSSASTWTPPPPLYVPPQPLIIPQQSGSTEQQQSQVASRTVSVVPIVRAAPVPVQPVYVPQSIQMAPPTLPSTAARISGGAPLVIDSAGSLGITAGPTATGAAGSAPDTIGASNVQPGTRMRASALANRSMTVTQGSLLQAVLETGFDSTKPGFARAVVSRPVRSFDGRNVLIPRGSKLIGEYRSDAAQGQKRAVIIWTRLIRPDGMTIAINSPAVDTLGRGGVPANVNTHFFARLGDALLQTTIGLGASLAQRSISGPVVVLPQNGAVGTGQVSGTNNYVPTLTVPAGKSISVFVAHDLDFSAAGAQQ